MRLFEEPLGTLRIAAYSGFEFPVATENAIYSRLDKFAEQLSGTCRFVHTVVADPSIEPVTTHARLGTGILVLADPRMQLADVEHFRATLPDRFDPLVRELAEVAGMSFPFAIAQAELQSACSGARWLQAWSADLIVSIGLTQFGLHAIVSSHLLDIPRLLVLDALPTEPALLGLLPIYAGQANWILVTNSSLQSDLISLLGEAVANKIFSQESGHDEAPAILLQNIKQRLDQPRLADQPKLGAKAALLTTTQRARTVEPTSCPLLILGAERTGTNLLVNMLATHPDFRLANELFNPRLIRTEVMPWLGNSHQTEDELKRMRRSQPKKLFETLLCEGHQKHAKHAGFKLLYYHALIDDRVTDMLHARDDMPVIHLFRRQRLERFASLERAQEEDKWSSIGQQRTSTRKPIEIQTRAMVTDFVQTTQFEQRYRLLFQDHRVLEIDYQELNSDLPEVLGRISEWLGVDISKLQPKTNKTGAKDVRDSIANWQHVCDALEGSPWSSLTDPKL